MKKEQNQKENDAKVKQQKYIELQVLSQQINQLQKQLQVVENQIAEIHIALDAFNSLKKTKPGTEILVPISNGVFAKAELKDNSELLVNVGANTVVLKSVDDTKSLIESQLDEVTRFHSQLLSEIQKVASKLSVLEKEFASQV